MREQVKAILRQKGQSPIYSSIDKSILDFKRLQYTKGEIKETIRDFFFGLDTKVDDYIISAGY